MVPGSVNGSRAIGVNWEKRARLVLCVQVSYAYVVMEGNSGDLQEQVGLASG
jgi:hypothetical protein